MSKRNRQIVPILCLTMVLICMTAGTAFAATSGVVSTYSGSYYLLSAVIAVLSVLGGVLAGMYIRRKQNRQL